jgi:prevent-host-death family protein
MDQVNIHQAKTQLSRLLERVAAGEEIVIAKSGKPLAKLVPFREVVQQPSRLKGKIKIGRDFAVPLPDALASVPPRLSGRMCSTANVSVA